MKFKIVTIEITDIDILFLKGVFTGALATAFISLFVLAGMGYV